MYHKSTLFFSILFICLLLFISCNKNHKPRYDLKIYNSQIIDLENGSIQNMDIFINGGLIVKLDSVDIETNSNALNTIDGSGKFALPGFWDNHVHFRGGDSLISANKNFLKLFIANGVTAVRDAGGDLTTSVMSWKSSIKKGDLLGPDIFTSGPKIDGLGATWAGSLEVENKTDIENALDSLQKIPTDFVKLYDSRVSGENYLSTIRSAEKRNLITSGHMPFTVTLDATLNAGIDAVEHLYYIMKGCSSQEAMITEKLLQKEIGFWDAMPLLQNSYNETVALETFKKLKQKNVFVVPTLHIGNTLSYIDETDHSKDTYLKYMLPSVIQTYQGRIDRAMAASEKSRQDRKKLDTFFQDLAVSLNNNGVSLLAGSDSGAFNSFTYPGISLHQELQAMVASGISPLDALRTSAYNGAKFLKKDKDYGTISEEKIADIVLLNSNPIADIKKTKDIFMVIKNGIKYDAIQLDSLLQTAVYKP